MEITAKTPWLKNMGDVPATVEYHPGSIYDAVSDIAKKYPDNVAFDFMGAPPHISTSFRRWRHAQIPPHHRHPRR
jgi:hypothetical protein